MGLVIFRAFVTDQAIEDVECGVGEGATGSNALLGQGDEKDAAASIPETLRRMFQPRAIAIGLNDCSALGAIALTCEIVVIVGKGFGVDGQNAARERYIRS